MTRQSPLTQEHIFAGVFFALLLFLLYQLFRILSPFSSALLWAALLTLALSPVHRRVRRLVRGRASLAAGIMTAGAFVMIIGPAIFILTILAGQAVDFYRWTTDLVQSGKLTETWNTLALPFLDRLQHHPLLIDVDVKGVLIKGLNDITSGLATQLGAIVKNSLLLVANLFIMLIALFFFFRDGEAYYTAIAGVLPFTASQRDAIAARFLDTFSGVINGVFLIALLQGIMTGIGFAVFGISFPVFWGFLAAVLALLPVGGAAIVWLPGALYLYLAGSKLAALLLLIWGTVLVSLPDNFLKPLLIGRKAKIPVFLLFLGILGGLKVYGVLGILFGPLVVTLLTVFVRIYREEYGHPDSGHGQH
ncbi:MAG: AI-2E family transporter [Nitrospiraceae bacterium]|nr:AI-2E family transporter [Nitrospiraceae bacterium]